MRFLLLEPAHDWTDQSVEDRLLASARLLSLFGIIDPQSAETLLAAIRNQASAQRNIRTLYDVFSTAFDQYQAGNGRMGSIEGEDGEKCWIIPHDTMESVRHAIAAAEAGAPPA